MEELQTERKKQQIMYSKSYILLFIANAACAILLIFSKQYEVQAQKVSKQETVHVITEQVALERFESLERIISYQTMKQRFCIDVSDEDLDTLMRIVQAEAGGEDRKGKLLVANVVINRVKNKRFPNTVTEVVFSALKGEDVSDGALFFMARKYADSENAQWFDSHLTFLFTYGGHDFYKR